MWIEFNPNPDNAKRVGDCTVRAISKALNVDWDRAFLLIVSMAYTLKDMPSANSTWGAVLHKHGFQRFTLPTDCPDCFTVKDFCLEYKDGTYVLGTGSHVVTAIDGNYFDSWDSGDEIVAYVWHRDQTNSQ